jgi:WD40 repeat protein
VAGAVVIVAGGIGGAIALSGGGSHSSSSSAQPKPSVTLSGATKVATLTSPVGGTMGGAKFSTDGTLIAAPGGTDHKSNIYIFSATTRKYVTTLKMPGGGTAYPLSFTTDDQALIAVDGTSSSTWNMYIFILATGKTNGSVQVPSTAYDVNDDGTVEANETLNAKFIDVYDLTAGTLTGHFPNPTTASTVADSLFVSRNGQEMLISAVNGKTYVMSTASGQVLATFSYHYVPKGDIPALSPDGKTVFIPGGAGGPSQIWSVATQANVTPHNTLWPAKNGWVIYSTDGGVVATSAPGAPSTDLWNVALGSHITTVTIPGSGNWGVDAIGPSGDEALFSNNPDKNNDSAQLYLYSVP